MSEKEKNPLVSHEKENASESALEVSVYDESRVESARDQLEKAEELHKKKIAEREALEKASEIAEVNDKEKEDEKLAQKTSERKLRGAPSKEQLRKSFNNQMQEIQAELSLPKKIASKFLHAKPVESASDFIESTIARPNALLSGSIAAFIAVTASYFIAKYYGFELSGFETLGAFVLGWLLGIVYDYASSLFKRNK